MVKESVVQSSIVGWLRKQPDTFVVKFAAGPFTLTGVPDLLVCVAGRYLAMEVKVGKNKPTPIQLRRIEEIEIAGGRALVVRSLAEAQDAWRDTHDGT